MKAAIVILFTFTTWEAVAQHHRVGVVGGAYRTGVTSGDFTDFRPQYRGGGGISYEYLLDKTMVIGANVLYARREFTDDLEVVADQEQDVSTDYRYDYLSVPLKVGIYRSDDNGIALGFVNVGLVPSLLLNATTDTPGFEVTGEVIPAQMLDVTDQAAPFDLAGLVEFGVGAHVVGGLWWAVSATYQHSLTSITNDRYFDGTALRHNSIGINVAMKHLLNSEVDY